MVANVHNSLVEQTIHTLAFPNPSEHTHTSTNTDSENPSLKLSQLLQTSLVLEQVLQLFFNEIQSYSNISSMGYRNEKTQSCIDFGRSSKHSCNYSLQFNNQNLGDLILTRSQRFSEQDLHFIETMIGSLVCPIRNALLYKEALQAALKDPLTQLGNRVALETTIDREVNLAHRHQQPYSMLIVDIDHFKHINDNYGHAAGDIVLKEVAQKLAFYCRGTDACYRYGGEEFVLLLSQTDKDGAQLIAERLRMCIEELATTFQEQSIQVTVSIGAASLTPEESHAELFIRADKALYIAKNNGRNKISAA